MTHGLAKWTKKFETNYYLSLSLLRSSNNYYKITVDWSINQSI